MIDLRNEDVISIIQACREPGLRDPHTRKACHVSCAYRYVTRGARAANGTRIKLEVVKTPRGLVTSREAIQRFVERLSDPDTAGGDSVVGPTTAAHRREAKKVDRELDLAGIV